MKKIFLPLLFVALGVFSFVPKSQNTQRVHAESAASQTYAAQTLIKDVWNNNLAEVDYGAFDFGVYHGSVAAANIGAMTKGSTEGYMSGDNCYIDLSGIARMYVLNNDSVILKFKAHTRINLTFSALTNSGNDWTDNSFLKYYIAPASYSFAKPTVLTPYSTIDAPSTIAVTNVELRAGETFFFEFGFQWGGSHRHFAFVESQLQFGYTANDDSTQDLAAIDLNLENVVKNPSYTNNGNFIETGLANYGMTFGNILAKDFSTPVINGENYIVDEIVSQAWWKLYAANNRGFAFTFTANERVNISLNVNAASFGGWVEHMQIYYIVSRAGNHRVVYTCDDVSPLTPSCFSNTPIELVSGETLYFYVTSYGEASKIDDYRNIMPGSTNDITFKIEEVKTTYNAFALTKDWLNLRAENNDFCVLDLEDKAKLDSYIERYNSLTNEEMETVGRVYDIGEYTIADTANYFAMINHESSAFNPISDNSTLIIVFISLGALGVIALFIIKKKHLVSK